MTAGSSNAKSGSTLPAQGRGDRRSRGGRWYLRLNVALAAAALCLIGLAQGVRTGFGGMALFGWRVPEACLLKAMTGRPCPGCGTARSVVLATQLRLRESAEMHPSGLYVAAWLAGQALVRALLVVVRPASRRVWIADLVISVATLAAAANLPWMLK